MWLSALSCWHSSVDLGRKHHPKLPAPSAASKSNWDPNLSAHPNVPQPQNLLMSLQSATSTHFCCFQSTPPILQELLIVDFLLWPAVHDFVAWFYWMPRNLQTDDSGWFRSHDIWSPAITTAFLISLLMFRRTLHLQENQAMPSMSPMKLHSLVSFCILVPAHNDGLHSLNPTTKASKNKWGCNSSNNALQPISR